MTNQQPKPLQLAALLDATHFSEHEHEAASELRRLYNALKDALDTTEKLKAQAARYGAEKAIAVQKAIRAEQERIKEANAPEIERINTLIKEREKAVAEEREACARIVEANAEVCFHGSTMRRVLETNAELIRARGNK